MNLYQFTFEKTS